MNIFLIHHRSPHHASNSGYGRLMDYLDATVVYGNTKFPFKIAKFFASIHSQSLGNYNVGSILKAIELYGLLKKNQGQKNIVHFLNGERDIRYLGFFKRKFPHTKFIATFHKPPAILKNTITDVSALRQLDGAIAVGANQVNFLKEWLQLEQVEYISHGVDTKFFVPDLSRKKPTTLLFVGQHLRDFDTFNNTVPKLATKIESLHINVVMHPSYTNKIVPHNYITILTDVKDEQLRKLYQEATILYLPMLNSTACNSLLEAMACGLPIITSRVGGNSEYLRDTQNVLVESRNEAQFIERTVTLLQNEAILETMGKVSRERALTVEWSNIAKNINSFYKKLS